MSQKQLQVSYDIILQIINCAVSAVCIISIKLKWHFCETYVISRSPGQKGICYDRESLEGCWRESRSEDMEDRKI